MREAKSNPQLKPRKYSEENDWHAKNIVTSTQKLTQKIVGLKAGNVDIFSVQGPYIT